MTFTNNLRFTLTIRQDGILFSPVEVPYYEWTPQSVKFHTTSTDSDCQKMLFEAASTNTPVQCFFQVHDSKNRLNVSDEFYATVDWRMSALANADAFVNVAVTLTKVVSPM